MILDAVKRIVGRDRRIVKYQRSKIDCLASLVKENSFNHFVWIDKMICNNDCAS